MDEQHDEREALVRLPDNVDEINRPFKEEVEKLSGLTYPPRNAPEWIELLTRAGFSQERIEQALHTLGYDGYDQSSELPTGYFSVPGDGSDGNWPAFSPMLMSGLRRYDREQRMLTEIPGESQQNQRLAKETGRVPENGPDDAGNFWWDGNPYALRGKGADLLVYIFKQESASDQDIAEDFYQQHDKPADSIRKAIDRLNQQLASLNAPFKVERRKGGPSKIIRTDK